MINAKRIDSGSLNEAEVDKTQIKLVEGYPPAYKKHLAKIDSYKKIIHDLIEGVKYRSKAYPELIGAIASTGIGKVSSGIRFVYGCSRQCVRGLVGGSIYPLALRIDGEVDKQRYIGRLGASLIVSGVYGAGLLFKSKTFLGFLGTVGSLFVIFGFFQLMGFTEKVEEDSRLWNMWDVPSVVFSSIWFIVPVVVMSLVFGYLGYKKSKDFRGLKYSWNSMVDGVIGKKNRAE